MTSTQKKYGRYEVLEQAGGRDLQICFKALDPETRREVLVKVHATQTPELTESLLLEAEKLTKLEHPNVVRTLDFGTQDGTPYLVEDLFAGEQLRQRMDREPPLSLAEKVSVLLGISEALSFAHSKGTIHLDLKPTNVWLAPEDQVKVADFGIARFFSSGDAGATRIGSALEMYGYISPEQLRGGALDERSDIFSLGALAYELLTSSAPFTTQSMMQMIREVLEKDPPPITDVVPDCPTRLLELVNRCLAKSPDKRFSGCDEICAELSAIRDELEPKKAIPTETSQLTREEIDSALGRMKAEKELAEETPTPSETGVATSLLTRQEIEAALEVEKNQRAAEEATTPAAGVQPERTLHLTEDEIQAALDREEPRIRTQDENGLDRVAGGSSISPALSAIGAWPGKAGAVLSKGGRALTDSLQAVASTIGSQWKPMLIGAAVLALLSAGGILLLGRQGGETEPETPATLDQAVGRAAPEPAPVTVAIGYLQVDAEPWAEIVRILGADSTEIPVPSSAITPVRLDLPSGRYEIFLAHPDAPDEQSCRVEIAPAQIDRCRVEFQSIDALEFLSQDTWGT